MSLWKGPTLLLLVLAHLTLTPGGAAIAADREQDETPPTAHEELSEEDREMLEMLELLKMLELLQDMDVVSSLEDEQ